MLALLLVGLTSLISDVELELPQSNETTILAECSCSPEKLEKLREAFRNGTVDKMKPEDKCDVADLDKAIAGCPCEDKNKGKPVDLAGGCKCGKKNNNEA